MPDALAEALRRAATTARAASVRRSASDDTLRGVLHLHGYVVEPGGVTCCGFGGDVGFTAPALNAHALRHVPATARGLLHGRVHQPHVRDRAGRPHRPALPLDR